LNSGKVDWLTLKENKVLALSFGAVVKSEVVSAGKLKERWWSLVKIWISSEMSSFWTSK
jgi:hypothetical protein